MELSISAKCKMEQRWHHFHQITSDTDTTDSLALFRRVSLGGCHAPSFSTPPAPATDLGRCSVFIFSVATVLAIFISGRR